MSNYSGAYSLTPPSSKLYETSEGEQTILRGINPDTMGAMYGFLLNQRAQADNNREQYGELLGSVNAAQQAIAARRAADERRQNDQQFFGNLVQHGMLPSSVAINATGGTDTLPVFQNGQQMALGTLQADELRKRAEEAQAYERAGTGALRATEAGFEVVPGQRIQNNAAGVLGTQSVSGTPLTLRREAMQQAGETARKSSGETGKIHMEIDTVTGEPKYRVIGTDPATVQRLGRGLYETHMQGVQGGAAAAGGNLPANPGTNAAGRPTPPPNPRTAPQRELRSDEVKKAKDDPAIKPRNGRFVAAEWDTNKGNVFWYEVDGKRVPVAVTVK